MADDFEKLDDVWMKVTEAERQKQVPASELRNFSAEVISKIYEQRMRKFAIGIGIGLVAATGVMAVLVHFYFNPLAENPKASAQSFSEVKAALSESVKDEDILDEIEAMKELGVWTEADEEAAGIPQDTMISEVEMFMDSDTPTPAVTIAAR